MPPKINSRAISNALRSSIAKGSLTAFARPAVGKFNKPAIPQSVLDSLRKAMTATGTGSTAVGNTLKPALRQTFSNPAFRGPAANRISVYRDPTIMERLGGAASKLRDTSKRFVGNWWDNFPNQIVPEDIFR